MSEGINEYLNKIIVGDSLEIMKELPTNERARTDLSAPYDGTQTKTEILEEAGDENL